MYLDNGKISSRQAVRMGILENIAVGIIFVPFLITRLAGRLHVPALFAGLIMFVAYSLIIYFFSVSFPMGFIDTLHTKIGNTGRILEGVYAVRYMIKAAVISVFFALVVQEYMLRSFNLWVILISFVLICGYGAARDIEKRGRLLEFLFWWMIIPLILVAVLSITNIKWSVFSWPVLSAGNISSGKMWEGAYSVLIVQSSVELMMMTLYREKKRSWKNDLNILIWVVIAIFLAYIYVVGILGAGWAGSGNGSALNVMQTTSVSDNTVKRLDYPVFSFWIIGVFATVSGYIFYAKEFAGSMLRLEREKSYGKVLMTVTLIVLIFIAMFNIKWWRSLVVVYLIWADIAISLIVPAILLAIDKYGQRIVKCLVLVCVLSFTLTGCSGASIADELVKCVENPQAREQSAPSIERRAYVTELVIAGGDVLEMATATDSGYEKTYRFTFKIADLSDYKGDVGAKLETEEYTYEESSIENAIEAFSSENKLVPDMGHIKKIFFDGHFQNYEDILLEASKMPKLGKSIIVSEDEKNEYTLMELISEIYDKKTDMQ